MTTREMVNMYTYEGKKEVVQIRFSGWTHDTKEVVSMIREMGYTVHSNMMMTRHHVVLNAIK